MKFRDEVLFEEAYKSNLYKVRHYAYSYLRDMELAENVAQDIFVRLWDNRAKVDMESDILPYLIFLTRNACLNILRRNKVDEKYQDYCKAMMSSFHYKALADVSSVSVYTKEVETLFTNCLSRLPKEVKDTFLLSRGGDFSNAEIAAKLGISVKTVESRITKVLKALRKDLADYLVFVIGFIAGNLFFI